LTSEIGVPIDNYTEPLEKGHGRIDARKASVFMVDPSELPSHDWDKFVRVIKVERFRETFDTKTKIYTKEPETSFYCATKKLTAQQYNDIIRGHWGIENSNHYVRDVSMKEDASRIRKNPQNMMRLKSFALNILRDGGVTNIAERLYENSVNIKKLFKLNIW
jgi:predicted transposase YbfD/YdcC